MSDESNLDQSRHPRLWAVMPAAGSGQRMQTSIAKQYLQVGEQTVLEHSLSAILTREDVCQVVLCVAEDDTAWADLAITQGPRVINTIGGESRAESVMNGLRTLAAVADADDWVLVHDAARPCLSSDLLDNLIKQLADHAVGGILAVPAKDTLKQVAADGCITRTVDRNTIYLAQTPQMFRFGLLSSALAAASEGAAEITDECSALELAGFTPLVVEGDYQNLKITTAEDLQIASAILASRVKK